MLHRLLMHFTLNNLLLLRNNSRDQGQGQGTSSGGRSPDLSVLRLRRIANLPLLCQGGALLTSNKYFEGRAAGKHCHCLQGETALCLYFDSKQVPTFCCTRQDGAAYSWGMCSLWLGQLIWAPTACCGWWTGNFCLPTFPPMPMPDLSPDFNALLCKKGGANVHISQACYLPLSVQSKPCLNIWVMNRFS